MLNPTTSPETVHFPVMLEEVIKICKPENGGDFIDCTFGGGSYSEEILKYPKTKVIAFDRDIIIGVSIIIWAIIMASGV